jgi:hypothetical protein
MSLRVAYPDLLCHASNLKRRSIPGMPPAIALDAVEQQGFETFRTGRVGEVREAADEVLLRIEAMPLGGLDQIVQIGVRRNAHHRLTEHPALSIDHKRPHANVHEVVLYALADTGMGAALTSKHATREVGSTIETKIRYIWPR